MPKIRYVTHNFSPKSIELINRCNVIISDYTAQGYSLTLRQLYYQLVARDIIPNNMQSYKRIGETLNDARLAGLVDWFAIEDRTRNLRSTPHWTKPGDIMQSAAASYRIDKWIDQPRRVEVWVEKDALVGILESVCSRLDVPFFSCRGYTSQSELWGAARRQMGYIRNDQEPLIIHLGDHDPSGKDMTRDITDRLNLFVGREIEVERIALNWDQIQQYSPPPNPAKLTDSRADKYIAEYGSDSWELDALEPRVIEDLIERTILVYRDEDLWSDQVRQENTARGLLSEVADRWDTVVEALRGNREDADDSDEDEGE